MKQVGVPTFIIEDQIESRKMLEDYLSVFVNIKIIGSYGTAEEALQEISLKTPQLIFLDVELPRKSGFGFLEDLKLIQVNPSIIFTTAFNRYALQAIKYAAFDYLLKPIDPRELTVTVNRFLTSSPKSSIEEKIDKLIEYVNPRDKIRLNTQHGFILVSPSEVIFCQADWNYTDVFFGKEKKLSVTSNIGKVEGILPRSSFIRINRSIIVNLAFIEKINRSNRTIHIKHGSEYFVFKISLSGMNVLNKLSF